MDGRDPADRTRPLRCARAVRAAADGADGDGGAAARDRLRQRGDDAAVARVGTQDRDRDPHRDWRGTRTPPRASSPPRACCSSPRRPSSASCSRRGRAAAVVADAGGAAVARAGPGHRPARAVLHRGRIGSRSGDRGPDAGASRREGQRRKRPEGSTRGRHRWTCGTPRPSVRGRPGRLLARARRRRRPAGEDAVQPHDRRCGIRQRACRPGHGESREPRRHRHLDPHLFRGVARAAARRAGRRARHAHAIQLSQRREDHRHPQRAGVHAGLGGRALRAGLSGRAAVLLDAGHGDRGGTGLHRPGHDGDATADRPERNGSPALLPRHQCGRPHGGDGTTPVAHHRRRA